jgi:hypothetical protein
MLTSEFPYKWSTFPFGEAQWVSFSILCLLGHEQRVKRDYRISEERLEPRRWNQHKQEKTATLKERKKELKKKYH